ncbi:methionine ABC transporter ATP-binding protein [Leucobacter chinensis]|uniref:methionine ABC transporter ATP-binding protein n=1 Tax=Leucobacter chinensis TaxID=2851010 RepID=UPI001C23CAF3|nr:ATP-binding cassette domain-containing protein [Leucobacter chinensis]
MTDRDAALTFTKVSKQYEGPEPVLALNNVSLEINPGEIFGIVGESGSGKSTFLDLCVGLLQPTSGSVRVLGTPVAGLSDRALRELRRTIGVVFQGNNLLSNETVADNIELPLKLTGAKNPKRVAELLSFVGLAHRAKQYPGALSGGERQRVAIARALMTQPSIVLFDEPTSALDLSTRDDILRLIRATNQEFSTTCVLVSHELDAVKAICQRAALFEKGKLREIVEVATSFNGDDEKPPYLDYAKGYLGS